MIMKNDVIAITLRVAVHLGKLGEKESVSSVAFEVFSVGVGFEKMSVGDFYFD